MEGRLCDSNLLLEPLNGLSSFPCNHLDCSLALLAPALHETEMLSSPPAPGIFIKLINQQQLPQGSSWHKARHQGRKQPRQRGGEPGAAAPSVALQVPAPLPALLLAAWALRCPGRAATLQCLEACEGRCCWGFPPGTTASSQSWVPLQEANQILPLKIRLEITGEAQAGKTSMVTFSR